MKCPIRLIKIILDSPKPGRIALSSSPEEDFVIVSANLTTDDQNNDSVAERK